MDYRNERLLVMTRKWTYLIERVAWIRLCDIHILRRNPRFMKCMSKEGFQEYAGYICNVMITSSHAIVMIWITMLSQTIARCSAHATRHITMHRSNITAFKLNLARSLTFQFIYLTKRTHYTNGWCASYWKCRVTKWTRINQTANSKLNSF